MICSETVSLEYLRLSKGKSKLRKAEENCRCTKMNFCKLIAKEVVKHNSTWLAEQDSNHDFWFKKFIVPVAVKQTVTPGLVSHPHNASLQNGGGSLLRQRQSYGFRQWEFHSSGFSHINTLPDWHNSVVGVTHWSSFELISSASVASNNTLTGFVVNHNYHIHLLSVISDYSVIINQ